MSSPSPFGPFRIPLPQDREVEVVLVRLADGRLVARTTEELELLKAANPPAERAGG